MELERNFTKMLPQFENEMQYNGYNLTTDVTLFSSPMNLTCKLPSYLGQPGYNWPALGLFAFVILALFGNTMVCLAVKQEKKLRNMFNYFLISLALNDMMSATLVLPLSIIKTVTGCLPVPKMVCITWYSLDVMFTSSTIIHLCMISIDRYRTFKDPLVYGLQRTKRNTALKIILVWIVAICIAGPLFILSMLDTHMDEMYYKGCGPETPTFVISATVSSFYLPLLIMTIMYVLTVRELYKTRGKSRYTPAPEVCISEPPGSNGEKHRLNRSPSQVSNMSYMFYKVKDTFMEKRNSMFDLTSERRLSVGKYNKDASAKRSSIQLELTNGNRTFSASRSDIDLCLENTHALRSCQSSLGINHDIDNNVKKSRSNPEDTGSVPGSPYRRNLGDEWKETSIGNGNNYHRIPRDRPTNSSTRSQSNADAKARKAVQVLGILFAVFVIFFLPFFLAYTTMSLCVQCRQYITPTMVTIFEFLAYSASMINPVIYHIFNPDFRRAFYKILRCKKVRRTYNVSSYSKNSLHKTSSV
ncbi:unnamed protein product [Owenia fusiformis]|uniref:G-protein coupled receptors family 1 profile domain-containing protein n=1 Tax=Owenia fusiformis TaxID=6347 RepID=A0A8S4NAC7_OWEFU|nr:unnamed protein product [Owenia fusiformis]